MDSILHVFNADLMPLKDYVALLEKLLSNPLLCEDNVTEFDHLSRFIILDGALKYAK